MKKSYRVDEIRSWDHYWEGRGIRSKRYAYDLIATYYRRILLKPDLNHFIKKYFVKNAKVLHAGCGGGEVDSDIQNYLKITALDFSQNALKKYKKRYGGSKSIVLGDIRNLKFDKSSFDGIYNLGVLEHFEISDIENILNNFHRVLKKDGTIIIFWPPEYGISVFVFKALIFVLKYIFFIRNVEFHPPEVSRLRSKKRTEVLFKKCGFRIIEYYFGWRDLFTNVAIVAKKS